MCLETLLYLTAEPLINIRHTRVNIRVVISDLLLLCSWNLSINLGVFC